VNHESHSMNADILITSLFTLVLISHPAFTIIFIGTFFSKESQRII